MTDEPLRRPEDELHGWNIAPDMRVWIGGHHLDAKRRLVQLFHVNPRPATGPLDAALIAAESTDEAVYFASKIKKRLTAEGVLWIIMSPDRASDVADRRLSPELLESMRVAGYLETGTRSPGDFVGAAFRVV